MRTPGGTWGGGRVAGPWSRINGECVAGVGRGTPWASGMVGRPPCAIQQATHRPGVQCRQVLMEFQRYMN